MRIRTKFGSLGLIAVVTFLLCISFVATTSAESDKLTVRVMTRNVDAGTDFIYFMTEDVETAVLDTIQEVLLSRIPERAVLLAAEIADTKPDLVALQEVTTWRFGSESQFIELNQLELLMAALEAAGQHYRVAVVQTLAEIEIPDTASFADHDAILVRTDLPPGHLNVLGTETHMYKEIMPFPFPGGAIPLWRGWIGADIKIRGARFKFANTHLESFNIDPNGVAYPQLNQAAQLVTDLQDTRLPIILAGDFNSAAPPALYSLDATPSYGYIANSGFTDAWSLLHPAEPGFTWPLFWEDEIQGPPGPIERIDLIFSKGPEAFWIENTGSVSSDGLYASDHVGVVADFKLENQRPDGKKK